MSIRGDWIGIKKATEVYNGLNNRIHFLAKIWEPAAKHTNVFSGMDFQQNSLEVEIGGLLV